MKEKIKVLLVEDELTLAMIIKDTLEENDFTLTIAANGEEGFRHTSGCAGSRRDDATYGWL